MRKNEIDRIRIEKEVKDYLAKGGKIEELPPYVQDANDRKAQIFLGEPMIPRGTSHT